MADRRAMRLAVTVSCVGLIADLAYIQITVAMLFLMTEEWAAGLAYGVGGAATVAVHKLGLTPRRPLRIKGVPTGWDVDGQTALFEDEQ